MKSKSYFYRGWSKNPKYIYKYKILISSEKLKLNFNILIQNVKQNSS